MNYRDYQHMRNAAWRILLDCGVQRLPVDLNDICARLGVRIIPYREAEALIRKRNLSELVEAADGLTFYADEVPVILYDSTCPADKIRFTVAHELGHLILMHIMPGVINVASQEERPAQRAKEAAANRFAARLLAPACVLWGLDAHSPEEIARLCRISGEAAANRAARMRTLYRRDKFLTSELEKRLYGRFLPYIEEVRGSACCSEE